MLVRARAFGMKPVACERALSSIKAAGLNVEECSTIDEVCSVADIVSLHVPLTPETRGLIGRPQLEALKPGAILVNTSRGGLIDREAMLWALETKGLRVGLDVYDDEPAGGEGTITDPIVDHPQVYGTHHIGASTQQAQDAVADEVVSMIASFMQRGEVPNVVNLAAETPAKWQLVVRHMDRVGVLANVLDVLKRNEINVQEIENIVFDGAHAASCRIRVDTKPGDEVLSTLRSFGDDIFGVQLVAVPKAAPTA
jgi:D-3-phosphoglycerate dehydrogenase